MHDFLMILQKEVRLRCGRRLGQGGPRRVALAAFLARTLDDRRAEIMGLLDGTASVDPTGLATLAQLYLEGDRPEDARLALEELFADHPDAEEQADLWAMLAQACVRTDCLGRAVEACHRLLDLSPEDMRPYNILLVPLVRAGRYDDAVALYNRTRRFGCAWPYGSPADFLARQDEAIARGVPAILLNALPKSASTYIGRSLQKTLGAPQCNIGISLFPEEHLVPNWLALFSRGGAVCSQHIDARAENLEALKRYGFTRMVVHVRDPRQAILSWTHYLDGRLHSADAHTLHILRRPPLPSDYPYLSFDDRLDWQIRHYLPHFIAWIERWTALAEDPESGFAIKLATFERFAADPQAYFLDLCDFYGLDLAPGVIASADKGTATNFRAGQIDEWRQVFSAEQQALATDMIPRSLRTRFDW